MPKAKKGQPAAGQPTDGQRAAAPTPNGQEKSPVPRLTKTEAVRRALAKLGPDAKPAAIQTYVRDECGVEMTTDHISTTKGILLRKAGGPSSNGAGENVATRTAKRTSRTPAPAGDADTSSGSQRSIKGISLDDVETVKRLTGRIGAEQLHRLVRLMAE